jgi:hypothetical protein
VSPIARQVKNSKVGKKRIFTSEVHKVGPPWDGPFNSALRALMNLGRNETAGHF